MVESEDDIAFGSIVVIEETEKVFVRLKKRFSEIPVTTAAPPSPLSSPPPPLPTLRFT